MADEKSKQSQKSAPEPQYRFVFATSHAKRRFWMWALAIFVVITFGLSGPLVRAVYDSVTGKDRGEFMFTMGGLRITSADMESAQRDTSINLSLRFGNDVPERVAKLRRKLDLQKAAALNMAGELGLSTGQGEVEDQLRREFTDKRGTYNEKDQIDFLTYKLPQLGIQPRDFIKFISDTLTMQKAGDALCTAALVPPYESYRLLSKLTDDFTVDCVTLPFADVEKEARISEDDAKAYFEKNSSLFRMPDRVKVRYAAFNTSDHADGVSAIRKERALDYYTANKDKYRTIGADGRPASKPFAEVRDDVYASADEQNVNDYYDLNKEEFTSEDSNGVPVTLTLEEARPAISNALIARDALAATERAAMAFAERLMNDRDGDSNLFERTAADMGIQIYTSEYLSVADKPSDQYPVSFYIEAFSLAEEDIPGKYTMPVSSSNAVFILCYDHKIPSHVPEFSEVSNQVFEAAGMEKLQELELKKAEEARDEMRSLVKQGKSFTTVARDRKLDVQSSGKFSWYSPSTNIDMSAELMRNVADRNQGEFTDPVRTTNGFILAYVTGRAAGEMALQPELQFNIAESARQELAQLVFGEWQRIVTADRLMQEESGEYPEETDEAGQRTSGDLPLEDW